METINFTILYYIKGHNSGMCKMKSVKFELDLPLVNPNISKSGLILKTINFTIWNFIKGHYSGTTNVKSVKIKLK